MAPLETIVLIIAIISIGDAILGIAKPKRWFAFLGRVLKSKNAWIIPVTILVVTLVSYYFIGQQLTIIEVVPGLFLGVLITKMMLTAHSKEIVPVVESMLVKIDWIAVISDLIIAGVVFWTLFVK